MQSDLIYDIGLHRGEDTEFYLKKGFRVVAVEANPELCAEAREMFPGPLSDGRLTIVNKAIATAPGELTFFVNSKTEWGTLDPEWAARNQRLGAESHPITIEATTIGTILGQHGVPYFMKVDIEGFDMVALSGLAAVTERPKFVSIESDKDSLRAVRREISTFVDLGYDRFKLVPQGQVRRQVPPNPAREGLSVAHQFPEHASGCFGEEAPGEWVTADQAIEAYKKIFFTYAILGDDRVAPKWVQSLAWRMGMRCDWWDTHARRAN
ncbi:MAG TPA: FkbM family methyltransferase [Phenylobacterium sp.]|jgi:FkbM family methyltransferase